MSYANAYPSNKTYPYGKRMTILLDSIFYPENTFTGLINQTSTIKF